MIREDVLPLRGNYPPKTLTQDITPCTYEIEHMAYIHHSTVELLQRNQLETLSEFVTTGGKSLTSYPSSHQPNLKSNELQHEKCLL